MKILGAMLVCAMLVAGCSGGNSADDNTREIHKKTRHDGVLPVGAMDDALQAEAQIHMATIYRQIKLKGATSGDAAAFYRSISGRLDSGKLAKLGISANELKGTNYQAGDYNLSFSGKNLTITASAKGTRGYVATDSYVVP